MHVRLREGFQGNAETGRAGPQQAPRRLRRFLHHVAELAGQGDLAFARHLDRLDEHDVAAHRRPRQAGGDAYFRRPARHFALHVRLAGVALQRLGGHGDLLHLPLHHFERRFAEHALDFALQLADARLARVLGDEPLERGVGDARLRGREAGLDQLARQQILLRDGELLAGRVPG